VAGLDHPNIVTLYSVRKLADNSLALIMQYVPGETLQQALEREGAFSFGRARQVLGDIAQALGYAHARGIVHRDVKPENVFIDGRTGRALLSDFGIARSGELDPRVTRTNVAIGTPAYMSPEQIDGGTIDGRSDLYSLGLVGWELIAGQQPWQGESLYGVIYRQKHDELPPLDDLRRETPPELIAAVEGALEKNARVRWARADDFLDVLTGRVPPPPRRPRRDRPATTRDFMLPPELSSLPTVEWRRGDGSTVPDPGALVSDGRGEPGPSAEDDPRPVASAPRGQAFRMPPEPRPRRRRGLFAVLAVAALSIGFATTEWQRREVVRPAPRVAVADTAPTVTVRVRPESAAGAIVSPPVDSALLAAADSVPDSTADSLALAAPAESAVALAPQTPAPVPSLPALPAPRSATPAPAETAATPPSRRVDAARESAATVALAPDTPATQLPSIAIPDVPSGPPTPPAPPAAVATDESAVLTASSAATATLAPGGSHTCEIAADSTALCWGANNRGQLGDGTSERRTAPTPTATDLRFSSISAGLSHTCAVSTAGAAYCWGANELGQLGDGTLVAQDTPTRVRNVARVRVVESANTHSCAITTAAEVYCWGANSNGELGSVTGAVARSTAVRVPSANRFAQLALGWNHTCALTTSGQAVCWGQGSRGQLGDGSTVEQRGPAPVVGSQEFVSVAAGSAHSCAISNDGVAYCWGSNNYGQLGDGSTAQRGTPTPLQGTARFVRVTAGSVHTCALTVTGAAYCWGRNTNGQLGDGTQTDRSSPVRVQSREPFVALRASGAHTCATTASRRNVCWGYNLNGQLGDGTRTHRARPVAVIVGS
jgi:alpha-tubulin suppressor-like RCC1 family protein